MATKQPSVLVPFSRNWIGGDIHGLSALAGRLYGYCPAVAESTGVLERVVDDLVHDAGWSGGAAQAFRTAWGHDAIGMQAFALVLEATGHVVDGLAVSLARLEAGLEGAAQQARAAGVPVGDDGALPVTMGSAQMPYGVAVGTAKEYLELRQQYLDTATLARDDATAALQGIQTKIAPPAPGEPAMSAATAVTIADYLRGFWAIPSAYRKAMEQELAELTARAAAAKAAWVKAKDSRPSPTVKMPQDVKDALRGARSALAEAQSRLVAAEESELRYPFSKLLDARFSSVFRRLGADIGEAGGFKATSKLGRWVGDLPLIDAGAAVLGTFLGARDDMEKGQGPVEAIAGNAMANIGGLAAGALAGTAVAGLVAGGAYVGAPVAAVAAGTIVGGVVAIGVGDFATNMFHEHWDEDIRRDGVLGGVADGVGHAASNTVSDMKDMVTGVGHAISNVWGEIF